MTYALCGFANLGSLGIMIGGIGSLVPERRAEIAGLGFKSIFAGTLATLMTGAIAGLILLAPGG
jgi:CNT family concentrative nucleoside transporter